MPLKAAQSSTDGSCRLKPLQFPTLSNLSSLGKSIILILPWVSFSTQLISPGLSQAPYLSLRLSFSTLQSEGIPPLFERCQLALPISWRTWKLLHSLDTESPQTSSSSLEGRHWVLWCCLLSPPFLTSQTINCLLSRGCCGGGGG